MIEGIPVYSVATYQPLVNKYYAELTQFIKTNPTIEPFLSKPVDHIAVKAYGPKDLDLFVKSLKPHINKLNVAIINNRKLVSVNLKEPLAFGPDMVAWIEAMQPKLGKEGQFQAVLEHSEFYYPDFEEVIRVLKSSQISYTLGQNDFHKTLVMKLNKVGQEVKITDRPLIETLALEEAAIRDN